MTTLTTVLALLPLAACAGESARLRSPMAFTIIGGIVTSTLGSLLVLPCLYLILDFRGPKPEPEPAPEAPMARKTT
jgi:HAE1 family hydrophobic/amphiphilic exporter-1